MAPALGRPASLDVGGGVALGAQDARQPVPAPQGAVVTVNAPPAILRYSNRPITTLRANVLSRTPAERAAGADRILDRCVRDGTTSPVTTRPFQGLTIVSVGSRDIFAITPEDVDQIAGDLGPPSRRRESASLHRRSGRREADRP